MSYKSGMAMWVCGVNYSIFVVECDGMKADLLADKVLALGGWEIFAKTVPVNEDEPDGPHCWGEYYQDCFPGSVRAIAIESSRLNGQDKRYFTPDTTL